MRGRDHIVDIAGVLEGNTPARAGKRPHLRAGYMRLGKYPHLRGEDIRDRKNITGYEELPPPARGRSVEMSTLDDLSRTTPHLRGEEASSPAGTKSRRELPPPARGRAALREQNVSPGGTTPTCAGKSYDPEYHARRRRNYPHLRGEECSSPPSSASAIELPPPARGRGGGRWRVVHPAGTTPTCAGKRRNTRNFIAKIWNYPHLRGEEACLLARQARQMELPPPARGRADLEGNYGTISGTTPTCAGKRRSRAPVNPSKRNYPHLRGEEAFPRSAFQWS